MMNTKILSVAMAFMLLGGMSVLSSKAAADLVIYDLDFETQVGASDNYNPNFDQSDPGFGTTSILSYPDLTGLDGTRTAQVDVDTTDAPFSFSYFTNLGSSGVDAPVSSDISDYVLSFDVRAEGFNDGVTSISSTYRIQINDTQFEGSLNTTSTYQSISENLSDLNSTGGTFELADFTTGTQQFRFAVLGADSRFNDVTDNNLYQIDNVRLTQLETSPVPEPGSLSLLALGTVLVSCRRRRA